MFALTIVSRSGLRFGPRIAAVASAKLENTRQYTSTMHDNDPEVLEREKHKNLTKTQHNSSPHEHAPGWNETLASASEASVKADRSSGSPDELQSSTVKYMRARRNDTEGEDDTPATTAFYVREEIAGPLKDRGKEQVIATKETITTDNERADAMVKKITDKVKHTEMTNSEEFVKADRGEF